MAVAFNLLWLYASRNNRLPGSEVDQQTVRSITDQYRFGPLFYLITFGIAWLSAPLCIALNLLLAVFFALPSRKLRPPLKEKKKEENDYA